MTEGKPIVIGVPKETYAGERRVALLPDVIPNLEKRSNATVIVEAGAGMDAGILDSEYEAKGAKIVADRATVFKDADVVFQVRTFGANSEAGQGDLSLMRDGQIVIGHTDSLGEPEHSKAVAETGAMLFSLEMLPRITRAQSMDVLSSQATIAGYKAVLVAAEHLPKIFPMFMTAAGTIAPARVFVIGAGVAGLQAIATAKRLGAIVCAYDVRPAVKEQVQSLGADFVELEVDAGESEDKGGYAKEMDEEFYRKQRELMAKVVAENDVVVTTAAIPGKKSPVLVTKEMVDGMHPGSVIVDLASERGGNCELTKAAEKVEHNGVLILGPVNVPSSIPYHASQMYSRNITTFFQNMVKEGAIDLNMEDEIIADTLVTRGKEVVNNRVREMLGMSTVDATEGS